jgi:hypothetical protein
VLNKRESDAQSSQNILKNMTFFGLTGLETPCVVTTTPSVGLGAQTPVTQVPQGARRGQTWTRLRGQVPPRFEPVRSDVVRFV